MSGRGYFDVADILTEEILAPVLVKKRVSRLGRYFDPGSSSNDVLPETKLEMPLWLATSLASSPKFPNAVHFRSNAVYGKQMQRRMHAGPEVEDLRARCPVFYDAATKIWGCTQSDHLAQVANEAFRARYKTLLSESLSAPDQRINRLRSLLTEEEAALFERGRQAVERLDHWRLFGASLQRSSLRSRGPPTNGTESAEQKKRRRIC